MQIEIESSAPTFSNLDIQEFVQNATWRELLTELVTSNRLDPWDIDITKVVDSYLKMVRRMKVLDLKIPANIILAASILLRMKSESLSIFEINEMQQLEQEQDGIEERARPNVDSLVPRARMQPRRKVTLNELLEALDEAIKMQEKRHVNFERVHTPINLVINEKDIDEKKEIVVNAIKSIADRKGLTTFSALSSAFKDSDSIVLDLFVPLLFLAQDNAVLIIQENFFDEIFIKQLNGETVGRAK